MQPKAHMSVEEYLAFDEADLDHRWEYWDGEVVPVHGWDPDHPQMMAGASPRHVALAVNLLVALKTRLRACFVGASDLRTEVSETKYVYPDTVVTCEEPAFNGHILLNPQLVIEIASKSTVGRDRDQKLTWYTQRPSVQAYWIVEQHEPRLTRFSRRGDGWHFESITGLDAAVDYGGHAIPLSELYEGVLELPA